MMREINKVDLGTVQIHKKVIADIASSALSEIDGVKLIAPDIKNQLFEFFGYSFHPGILVSIDRAGQVSLEARILVRYGLSIPDIARLAQDVVRSAVEKIADIHLKDVHVNVQGIQKEELKFPE